MYRNGLETFPFESETVASYPIQLSLAIFRDKIKCVYLSHDRNIFESLNSLHQ